MLTLNQTIITSHFLHHRKLDLIYIKAERGNCALLEVGTMSIEYKQV